MAPPDVGTPEWWLRRLHGQVLTRRDHIRTLHDYYDGRQRLAFATQKFLEAFGGLFKAFSDNWCALIVDAVTERLNVEGFRVGDDPKGDADAWRIWQANELDAQSRLAHTESLICGESYATVWLRDPVNTDESTKAEITVESPQGAIVECHPKMRRRRLAGLRLYQDEWGYEHAELFLPDDVYLYRSIAKRTYDITDATRVQWQIDDIVDTLSDDGSMRNPLGVVPMVPLVNRPRLAYGSRAPLAAQSELTSVIPVQDAVNKLMADMIVTSEFAGYPQRYMLGLEELPRDPATGKEINPYTPDKRVWLGEGDAQGYKIGEFSAASLDGFVNSIAMLIQHIASITRTPPHYLNASADRLSGESIKAAETGLVAKVRERQFHLGEGWEEVMRLAGHLDGIDKLAAAEACETIWGDPESRTESEHVDAVTKKAAVGVPMQQLWEDLGYSPAQIARFKEMRAEEPAIPVTDAGYAPQPLGGPSPAATPAAAN